jgi:hypothetical protein
VKGFQEFLLNRSFWAFEMYSTLVKLNLAYFLLNGDLRLNSSYYLLWAAMPNEAGWGLIFLVVGLGHAYTLLTNNHREAFILCALSLWSFASIVLFQMSGLSAGSVSYALLAGMNVLAFLRQVVVRKAGNQK